MKHILTAAVAAMLGATSASADQVTYRYDALGRLVMAERRAPGGATGNGYLSEFGHDTASNRTVYRSSGAFLGNMLAANTELKAGQALLSNDARFLLTLQHDGNLVLYDQARTAIWSTGTQSGGSHFGDRLAMQQDGNLVLYRANGMAAWATMTVGQAGLCLVVQPDGNVVLYRPDDVGVWSTGTCCR